MDHLQAQDVSTYDRLVYRIGLGSLPKFNQLFPCLQSVPVPEI